MSYLRGVIKLLVHDKEFISIFFQKYLALQLIRLVDADLDNDLMHVKICYSTHDHFPLTLDPCCSVLYRPG